MYQAFFGFRERPFDLTPDPRYLMMTRRHQEALSTLEYGISGGKGVALVLGGAGTGKTTLVHAALENQQGRNSLGVCLSNPALTRAEFLEFLASGFHLGRRAAESKTQLITQLRGLLQQRHADGAATALIIDEAQSLPDELLEEIRLLANIETSRDKLLAVVLVGHPELGDRLNQPHLQQFKQRVALRTSLTALNLEETRAYVSTRIGVAGGNSAAVFTEEAIAEIARRSAGIPRTINVICDNALVSGFALDRKPVGREIVVEVSRDLDFGAPDPASPAAPGPRAHPAAPVARPATSHPSLLAVVDDATTSEEEPTVAAEPSVADRGWGFRNPFRSQRRTTSLFETSR